METFTADNIYKSTVQIEKRVGANLAVCRYGKKFMLYNVATGKTVQHRVKPFDTVQDCQKFAEYLLFCFPGLDDDERPVNVPGLTKETYNAFLLLWSVK